MSEQQYPAWQNAIRKAQKIQQEINASVEQDNKRRMTEKDAQHGRNLARVLDVAFGIKLDEMPVKNNVEVDGYDFWLKTHTSNYDDHSPVFFESNDDVKPKLISFTLWVNKVRPDYEDFEEWESWPRSVDLSVRHEPVDDDWTPLRATLADVLDRLARDAEFEVTRFLNRPKLIETPKPKPLTLDDIIEQMVDKKFREMVDAFGLAAGEF